VPTDAPDLVRAMVGAQAGRAAYSEVRALRRQWAQPARLAVDERTLRLGLSGVAPIQAMKPREVGRPVAGRHSPGRSQAGPERDPG
jgi:hypothetical protein